MQKNEFYEISAVDLTTDGNGVGRIDNMAVFVPGMLPKETAKIKIIKAAKNYAVGRLEELLIPSKDRTAPKCAAFKRCGGCSLQHLSYEAQLKFKQKRVTDCIRRIGKSDAPVYPIIGCSKQFRYRNKTAFPVRKDSSGKVNIGCFSYRSHDVVDIDDCLISSKKCAQIISVIRRFIEKNGISVYDESKKSGIIRHIVIRESSLGECMVGIVINSDDLPKKDELILELSNLASSIVLNVNKAHSNAILSDETKIIYGKNTIREKICGLYFDISLNSFLQINHEQMQKLYSLALDVADITNEKTVVDLYCGAGTIGLIAAKRAKRVYGIEIVAKAIENARKNMQLNGIDNAQFLCADCAEGFSAITSRTGTPDIVIVDPPRKGLSEKVISDIAGCGVKKIVYISCDPATLSRDILIFSQFGYDLKGVTPVDMFPNTCSIESVSLLTKS